MRQHGRTQIKASHLSGFTQPDRVAGYIPNATASGGQRFVVVEAETGDGLDQDQMNCVHRTQMKPQTVDLFALTSGTFTSDHTKQQLLAFYGSVKRTNGILYVAVNTSDAQKGKALLNSQRIVATVWPC